MLMLIAIAGCSHGPVDRFGEGEAVPVLAAKVVQKTVADTIHAIGRVEAFSTVDVKAQISGQVMQVNFRQGQDVKQGDLLFTIDPRPFEAALREAQANLAKDRAQARQAAIDEGRQASLLKQNVGSRQQYDQAVASAAALAATVQADEAAVQTAKLNLEYTANSRADRRTHRRSAGSRRQPGEARCGHRDGRDQPGAPGVRRLRGPRAQTAAGSRVHGEAQARSRSFAP